MLFHSFLTPFCVETVSLRRAVHFSGTPNFAENPHLKIFSLTAEPRFFWEPPFCISGGGSLFFCICCISSRKDDSLLSFCFALYLFIWEFLPPKIKSRDLTPCCCCGVERFFFASKTRFFPRFHCVGHDIAKPQEHKLATDAICSFFLFKRGYKKCSSKFLFDKISWFRKSSILPWSDENTSWLPTHFLRNYLD